MRQCNPTTPFGKEVKKALIDKGMLQIELCEQLGIQKQYLNLILTGKRSGKKYIGQIISILGIDPDEYSKSA